MGFDFPLPPPSRWLSRCEGSLIFRQFLPALCKAIDLPASPATKEIDHPSSRAGMMHVSVSVVQLAIFTFCKPSLHFLHSASQSLHFLHSVSHLHSIIMAAACLVEIERVGGLPTSTSWRRDSLLATRLRPVANNRQHGWIQREPNERFCFFFAGVAVTSSPLFFE